MEEREKELTDDLKFDEALKKLEDKVDRLEDGELPLEDALEHFKEGIVLVKICSEKIKEAETTINELVEEENINSD